MDLQPLQTTQQSQSTHEIQSPNSQPQTNEIIIPPMTREQINDGLIRAAHANRLDVIKYLVTKQNGIVCDVRDEDGNNLLHIAAQYGYIDIIDYIVSIALSLLHEINTNEKVIPILTGASYNQYEVVRYFVIHTKSRLDAVTLTGENLLHLVVRFNNMKIFDTIYYNNKSLITQYTHFGRSPLQEAYFLQRMHVVSYIVRVHGIFIAKTLYGAELHELIEFYVTFFFS